MTLARFIGGVLRHAGKAAFAAITASSIVLELPKATCLLTSPVEGL